MEKKNNTKITFTLNKELKEEFDKYIKDNLLNRSHVIEYLIKEYLIKEYLKKQF